MGSDKVIRPDRWRDFNDAAPQGAKEDAPGVADIKARMLAQVRSVLGYLLPGGVIRGNVFVVGSIDGEPGNSMEIELSGPKAGLWKDHATDDKGDILHLWALKRGFDLKTEFPKVMEDARDWLGVTTRTIHDDPPPKKEPPIDNLGPRTGTWRYITADGELIAEVYRYDPEPGRKEFRPWDVKSRKMRAPDPRPLYNQPGIADANQVVLVEGEKCAQALIEAGVCATTAMNGAKSPVEKTDWSPLKGKQVLIWPDKDPAGWDYAERAAVAVMKAGAVSCETLIPEASRAEKWDAADAVEEGVDPADWIASAERKTETKSFSIFDWNASRYSGKAPEERYLVDGSFPLKKVSILAAMGDTGKGMLGLDLALQVATGKPPSAVSPHPKAFGGYVREFGTAVVFTAEDDLEECHRRLERLDPHNKRLEDPDKLIVIALPNAGGPIPLVAQGRDGPMVTQQFAAIRDELRSIEDLKLIIFDPMSSFIHADITADPAAGSFATGLIASLATETGACVLIAHHMRKPQGNRPIESAEQARDAIRGTSAIVDGVRLAYALWPAPGEQENYVFRVLEMPHARSVVYLGAVVKANGPADRTVRTFVRDERGLLVDQTDRLREANADQDTLLDVLEASVARAAEVGHPFTHTSGTGVYRQRQRLPEMLRNFGKHRLESMIQRLLNDRRLVKGMASGSREDKWLDIPSGPFAKGVGEFEYGADKGDES